MRLLRPLFFLLIAAYSAGTAMAADGEAEKAVSFDFRNGIVGTSGEVKNSQADSFDYASLLLSPRKNILPRKLGSRSPGIALDANGDVCYTMRSFKVKPKERFAESEDASAGYSTCEMASSFRVRSAYGDSAVKLK